MRGPRICLYHDERFYLACFLNAAGWDAVAAIEPLFVHMPDYSARETHKQVQSIVDKGYKPAGCRKLKVWGMCPHDCGFRTTPASKPVAA